MTNTALLQKIEDDYDELISLLNSGEVVSDNKLYLYYLRQKKELEDIALLYKSYKQKLREVEENKTLIETEPDAELKKLLTTECSALLSSADADLTALKKMLLDKKSLEIQTALVEFTSDYGDEKAQTFFEILKNYAQKYNHKILSLSFDGGLGQIELEGYGIFDKLKIFSGQMQFVFRGKTTSASVAILRGGGERIEFDEGDVEVQTLKSGGAGGQHINKTESAVRVIHRPTGITAECQDERSQFSNKARALELLREKIEKKNQKNIEKNINFQRKQLKNALFSDVPSTIFNFDENQFIIPSKKFKIKLSQILNGDLDLIFSEIE